jgi:hypothetical protein
MKKLLLVILVGIISMSAQKISAQNMAKSLGVYVFPAHNQDQATQDADEMACYKWAINQTGYDPMNPPVVQGATVDRSPDGRAVGGAARGAAGGAAIGAIAGDAGKGAAIGALVGGVRGRRSKVVGDEMQQQANDQAAAAKSQELHNDYIRAFSACLEGKGYTVK